MCTNSKGILHWRTYHTGLISNVLSNTKCTCQVQCNSQKMLWCFVEIWFWGQTSSFEAFHPTTVKYSVMIWYVLSHILCPGTGSVKVNSILHGVAPGRSKWGDPIYIEVPSFTLTALSYDSINTDKSFPTQTIHNSHITLITSDNSLICDFNLMDLSFCLLM